MRKNGAVALWAVVFFATVGCTSIATMEGARPIAPGAKQLAVHTSVQAGTNSLSTGLGLPVLQQDLALRFGLSENADFGLRLYLFGLRADVRYRFARLGPWDVAVAPAFGGLVVPTPSYQGGVVEVVSPLLFQRDLGEGWSLVLSSEARIRETFTLVQNTELGSGSSGYMQLMAGGGAQIHRHIGGVTLGLGADVLAQPGRALLPAWSGGFGLSWQVGRRRAAK
jgi:hypothetical protein